MKLAVPSARVWIAFIVLVLLGACGGASQRNAVVPSTSTTAAQYGSSSAGNALLYVSDMGLHRVLIYSYPGLRLRATLDGVGTPAGMCVDTTSGNVWIVEGAFGNKVVEFAHGATTPIRSLKIAAGLYPDACAVDPTSGNLAVAAYLDNDDSGSVLVFHHARGAPSSYQVRKIFYYDFLGYDTRGNLFVDGNGASGFHLAELLAGAKNLQVVSTRGLVIHHPGNVQYDGTNVAVGDEKRGRIYQLAGGAVTGTTMLQGTCLVAQFFIATGQVIVPSACRSKGEVLVYPYPAGGAPTAKIGGLTNPFGAVLSLMPQPTPAAPAFPDRRNARRLIEDSRR